MDFQRFTLALTAVLPCFALAMGSPIYVAKPIEAWVVDADTGQPIEGAIVTANWQLVTGSLDGTRYKGQLEVKESVTDSRGRFQFEGFSKSNPGLYDLEGRDPQLLIFKPGYEPMRLVNDYGVTGSDTPGPTRKSQHDKTAIRLKPFKGADANYSSLLTRLYRDSDFVLEACNWKRVPRFVSALIAESDRMMLKGVSGTYLSIHTLERGVTCGTARDFLKEYQK